MTRRAAAALRWASLALASGGLGGWLALHYPLAPALMASGVAMAGVCSAAWPTRWPAWLLGLLPCIGWTTWTGWFVVEELDLLVLGVAAGGYLRLAFLAVLPAPGRPSPRGSWLPLLCFAPILLSALIGMQRGLADAGGLSWGWWQGYKEPLNCLRLAKPMFEVLLLLPLWRSACAADEGGTSRSLAHGMVWMLLAVSLGVLWERLAFTGLLDFSSDYRATGPFWEMHVGGAGLDAALALSMPFAIGAASSWRTRWGRWATAVCLVGVYACLVTFSRVVYVALPVGVVAWWWLRGRALSRAGAQTKGRLLPGLLAVATFLLLAVWNFPHAGYRSLLALVGLVVLTVPLAATLRQLRWHGRLLGLVLGGVAAAGVATLDASLDKGAYLAYALAWSATEVTLAIVWWRQRGGGLTAVAALAGYVATLAAFLTVCIHWGGTGAFLPSAGAAAVLAALMLAASWLHRPLWPEDGAWHGQVIGAVVAAAALVGVFDGGGYMGGRLSQTAHDSGQRSAHWARALDLMRGADWWLGKGMGRYWANQSLSGAADDQTGDYRLLSGSATHVGPYVVLTSGRHALGFSEAFRLSQRVSVPSAAASSLRLHLRADAPVKLQAEICEKHLLYPAACQTDAVLLEAGIGQWQWVQLKLRGDALSRGPAYAPRLLTFSLSLGKHANRIELDRLELTDAGGHELLENGAFEQGLSHWYFTSDRYHLPWHLKNLALHLLFEQGLLGLGAWTLIFVAALWRLAFGAARAHSLAPVLAASLVSLLAVGVVDSILDMPRIGFVTLLLLAVALALPTTLSGRKASRRP